MVRLERPRPLFWSGERRDLAWNRGGNSLAFLRAPAFLLLQSPRGSFFPVSRLRLLEEGKKKTGLQVRNGAWAGVSLASTEKSLEDGSTNPNRDLLFWSDRAAMHGILGACRRAGP